MAAFLAGVGLGGTAPALAATSFILDVAAPSTQDVPLTVTPSSIVAVNILKTGDALAAPVTLDMSQFTGGSIVAVPFTVDDVGGSPATHKEKIPFEGPRLGLKLHVPPLPAGGPYTGRLILTASGQAQATVWRFILTSATELRPAALVIDQNVLSLAAVRPWCPISCLCLGGEQPSVTVHARDKSGNWPLEDLVMRWEPGLKAPGPGFDPKTYLSAWFNDAPADDLDRSPSGAGRRRVPAGEQATIRLQFHDLPNGDYVIPLRITAGNSAADDQQRLVVNLQVRDSAIGAIILLFLAALVSFVATRVVSTLRQRASFLARLNAMRPAWLAEEEPTLGVVWLRAALRQVEDLSKRFWLTSQAEIDNRLKLTANALAVLDRIRAVRSHIEQRITNPQVRRRAKWALDRFVDEFDPTNLTDQAVTMVMAKLDKLDSWAGDPLVSEANYWEDLQRHIKDLLAELKPSELGTALEPAKGYLERLQKAQADSAPANIGEKLEVEASYARLRILWDSRSYPEDLRALSELLGDAEHPIEKVYEVIDHHAWRRLKQALSDNALRLRGPDTSSLDPLTAYDTVTLRLSADRDSTLIGTFLVQKKLEYAWRVSLTSGKSAVTLRAQSKGPRVAQYSPMPATMKAEVEISYLAEKVTVKLKDPITIRKSRDFRAWQIVEAADVIAFLVALVVSVVSGVVTFALAPSFGSLKDYLALFAWGAGADQAKNFVQSLKAQS